MMSMASPSAMATTMARQPEDLRGLLDDWGPVTQAADRLRACERLVLIGTGTSWHAANVGAWFLREGGLDAWAVSSTDAALPAWAPRTSDGVIAVSQSGLGHGRPGGPKLSTQSAAQAARDAGAVLVSIGATEISGADIETVEKETSSAHTASYLGALMRLAQLAVALGAGLEELDTIPAVVAAALARDDADVDPPQRLMEYVGAGVNAWTAAEGALKVRETSRVASEGHTAEQCLHGPLVALDERDVLVALDAGPGSERVRDVVKLARHDGARVHVIESPSGLPEVLTVFPLTVAVQKIALHCANVLGTDPDAFGLEVPGRRDVWKATPL